MTKTGALGLALVLAAPSGLTKPVAQPPPPRVEQRAPATMLDRLG